MIDHNLKLIFIEIPKTATHTIVKKFTNDSEPCGWNHDYMLYKQHLSISELLKYDYITKKQYQEYFKFTFTRNPFERAVSEYFYRCRIHKEYKSYFPTFSDFILQKLQNTQRQQSIKQHLLPNYHFIYMNNICEMDFIGRFENLENDYEKLCELLNKSKSKLKVRNSTEHKHYSYYYTTEVKEILTEKYDLDIKHLNYSFDYE